MQRGDFVLRLSEGVNRPEETLRDYVVTPELKACFDNALSFMSSAVHSRTSKASYLHGSFGSGKSHFMAVLHLILQGNAAARSIPELAPVISKHNAWAPEKKFLLVPYHMIGCARYGVRDPRRLCRFYPPHPSARAHPGRVSGRRPVPGRPRTARTMGDAQFFTTLSEGTGGAGGWGDLAAGWDAMRFEAAMEDLPGSEERSQLISALLGTFFGSYHLQVDRQREAYLSLDKGLSVMSKHAASLGYDALILFLDELILWLASHAADLTFVHQEGQKLAKLVEAQTPDRPIPIISFVARQRDLSELIGDAVTGAERLNFSDALKHWEGRFHTITLEDRNLPAIAEKRVLKCKSPAARAELDAAFEQTAHIREAVMTTLLTSEGDREMFRKLYPFSPALVQTLIAVSSVLQRERTALKVMMQLLVEQRDTLTVGDILPVGDLFDVIAHGDEAFSQDMAIHFDNAKRLYHHKLLPLLENQHGRREDLERLPYDDPRQTAFRNDDRLVKTLLLAALVPGVESLRALNAERLAALNHGTIKTPIPGREGQEVLRRCRSWAASVGEIRIGEEANPTISIQLSGVETETIIEQARREDNQGNRIRRVRQMLFEQLGIDGNLEFEQSHDFLWRQTRRSCSVLFRNIRELPDTSFDNPDARWKLIIDYPFDEAGHGPRDDLSRVQAFRQAHPDGTKTLCWIPAFFSLEAQKDLGMLVILEHILTGERFASYVNHLSPQDRPAAKSLLENQRSVLRQRVQNHLEAAYGLEALTPGSLDTTHELELHERFVSLQPGFEPQPPVAAHLAGAMEHLLSQALEHEFPAAPHFEAEIKTSNIQKVYEQVRAAAQTEDGRVAIDKPLRPLLRHIANPLRLGEMGADATHFVLGQHWKNHLTRKAAETGGTIDVSQLRTWMNEPRPMGLPRDAENMVILLFAEQTNRSFFLHGAPCDATLTNLPDRLELREQQLPQPAQWEIAVGPRRAALWRDGLATAQGQQCHGARDRRAAQDRRRTAGLSDYTASACRIASASWALPQLRPIACGQSRPPWPCLSAWRTSNLPQSCRSWPPYDVATSESAMSECVSKAANLAERLDATNWEILEATASVTDERQATADEIHTLLCQGLASDEHVMPLAAALQGAQAKAVRVLATPTPTPGPHAASQPVPRPGRTVLQQGTEQHLTLPAVQDLLARLEHELQAGQDIHYTLSWTISGQDSPSSIPSPLTGEGEGL